MSRADVVLVHPTYSFPEKSPPLGLAYLQAYLRRAGIGCRSIDVDANHLSRAATLKAIESMAPSVVGISFMTSQAIEAASLAVQIKACMPHVQVVAGGCHTSALPAESSSNGFDAAVVSEGEGPLLDIVQRVLSDGRIGEGIANVLLRGQDETSLARRPLIADLDALPFPDWSDMPPGSYGDGIVGSDITAPLFSVLTSRGCPNDCIFCASNSVFERRFRKRGAESIFAELVELHERYGARLVTFVDDTLTIDRNRIMRLCDLISSSRLEMEWMCNARVNTVDRDMLRAMAEAGCRNICFGVESGDPDVLSRIKKRITLERAREAHEMARMAGISVSTFFMVGNLGETLESIDKTVSLALDISDFPSVAIATPYPGTELLDIVRKNGWLRTTDWSQYVTAPHVLPDYRPVATNGILSEEELMNAYYYVNRKFVHHKLVSKYGRRFYLNGRFYAHEVGARTRAGGLRSVAKIGRKLLSAKLPAGVGRQAA